MRPEGEGDIENFLNMRLVDQERIRKKISKYLFNFELKPNTERLLFQVNALLLSNPTAKARNELRVRALHLMISVLKRLSQEELVVRAVN